MPLVYILVEKEDLKRELSTFVRLLGPSFIGLHITLDQLIEKKIKSTDFIVMSVDKIPAHSELTLRQSQLSWVAIGWEKVDAYTALKCNASEFILWPFDRHILKSILLKSDEVLEKEEDIKVDYEEIEFKTLKGASNAFALRSIVMIEALGDLSYLYINLQGETRKLPVNESMKSLSSRLPSELFFRVHRKFIVNLYYVIPFGDYPKDSLQLEGINTPVNLSRRKKMEFSNWYRGNNGHSY